MDNTSTFSDLFGCSLDDAVKDNSISGADLSGFALVDNNTLGTDYEHYAFDDSFDIFNGSWVPDAIQQCSEKDESGFMAITTNDTVPVETGVASNPDNIPYEPGSSRDQKRKRQEELLYCKFKKSRINNETSSEYGVPAQNQTSTQDELVQTVPLKRKRSDNSEQSTKVPKKFRVGDKEEIATIVLSCGVGDNGELGQGPMGKKIMRPRPIDFPNFSKSRVIDLSCGAMHTVVALENGDVATWGVNDERALGRDTTEEGKFVNIEDSTEEDNPLNSKESTPCLITSFPQGTKIIRVAACDSYTFFVTDKGKLYGCGVFRFPDGKSYATYSKSKIIEPAIKPHEIEVGRKGSRIIDISAGSNHVVVLLHDGSVWTWGSGEDFQLGRRACDRQRQSSITPCRIYRGTSRKRVVAVFAGGNNTFVKTAAGEIMACGSNAFGECGIDFTDDHNCPIQTLTLVPGLKPSTINQIAVGDGHAIALTTEGDLKAWGRCDSGQVGDTSTIDEIYVRHFKGSNKPVSVSISPNILGSKFISICCGSRHSIGVKSDGLAWSWGSSDFYQIGQGPTKVDSFPTPTAIANSHVEGVHFTHVAAGSFTSVFAGYIKDHTKRKST